MIYCHFLFDTMLASNKWKMWSSLLDYRQTAIFNLVQSWLIRTFQRVPHVWWSLGTHTNELELEVLSWDWEISWELEIHSVSLYLELRNVIFRLFNLIIYFSLVYLLTYLIKFKKFERLPFIKKYFGYNFSCDGPR